MVESQENDNSRSNQHHATALVDDQEATDFSN